MAKGYVRAIVGAGAGAILGAAITLAFGAHAIGVIVGAVFGVSLGPIAEWRDGLAYFRHPLLARMSNTILAAGEMSQREMLARIKRGLLVETTLGNRSNAYGDPTRFNVVESYLVEKGEVAAPLQSFVLTGKPLDVLRHVSQIADDGVLATGICRLPDNGLVPYGDSQLSTRVERGLRIAGPLDLNNMLPALLGACG